MSAALPSTSADAYDYIVVGGGTSGCVLAARLSEDADKRVLMVEAGGTDWNPMIHIPLGAGKLLRRGLHGWKFMTEPIIGGIGQRLFWPRGKVLGGSSSLNAMIYHRGGAAEYDMWEAAGARGWSWKDVLPWFKKSEGHDSRGEPLHGSKGPHRVQRATSGNAVYEAFIAASRDAGHAANDDLNDGRLDGMGLWDFTIHHGRRQSAAVAYLRPASGRPNLTVVTRAHVMRVDFDDAAAPLRATGITYRRGGKTVTVRASREVALAAGAIGSPHLLMLSGIGDPDELRKVGIPVRHALDGVGKNLQDHVTAELRLACPEPITLHTFIRLDRAAIGMLRAAIFRTGPAATFPAEGGGFSRSSGSEPVADIQWYVNLGMNVSRLRIPYLYPMKPGPFDRDGFTLRTTLLRPKSRGSVRLASADPFANPKLTAGYLEHPDDVRRLRLAFRQSREVAAQPAFSRLVSHELLPGPQVQGDAEIDAYIRSNVTNVHHQSGTCRMGVDADAVVDPLLRVHGVERLRVIDASVMPVVTSGGTYAASVMIAERGAQFMRDAAGSGAVARDATPERVVA